MERKTMDCSTVEIRDEKGEGFDVVKCDDTVFPKRFLHMSPETRLEAIRDFKYRDGDVMICSFPKTGTHWVFNLVHFLMSPGPVDVKLAPSPQLLDLHPLEKIEELSSPRVMVSHLKPNHLPNEHLQNFGKIVLLVRNPKDTVVSHMYHTQRVELFNYSKMSWNCFFENWIKGQIPPGSFFDYYNSWQMALEDPNSRLKVHIVRYENLIKNGLDEMRRLQAFLETNNSEERMEQILERFSLRRMKVDSETGKMADGKENLVKKGVIGHWKKVFTVSQNEQFDHVIRDKFINSIFYYDV